MQLLTRLMFSYSQVMSVVYLIKILVILYAA